MKMKKFTIIIGIISVICMSGAALAATPTPEKVDKDRVIVTESSSKTTVKESDKSSDSKKSAEKATEKTSTKATEKASAKSTEKATAKATSKATEKASAKSTEKATAKATEKASAKSTEKTSAKSSEKSDGKTSSDKVVLDEEDEDVLVIETTPEPALAVQSNGAALENNKYLSKVGGFLWFLLGVIVSAVISFAISYRFFMIIKRDNRVVAELRALKRDIDSKMVGTVNGFSEYDVNVTNNNPSYARAGKPIHIERNTEHNEKSEEIFKKWETQIRRPAPPSAEHSESAGTGRPTSSGTYNRKHQPQRRKSVAGRIKGVFNDIFPTDNK